YTSTTLAQTSSSVAMNSTLSDLSFLATISAPIGPNASARNTLWRGQNRKVLPATPAPVPLAPGGGQSSVGAWGGTPTSQTGVVCVPSGRLPTAPRRLMTSAFAPAALRRTNLYTLVFNL